jgi:hypothetical protein
MTSFFYLDNFCEKLIFPKNINPEACSGTVDSIVERVVFLIQQTAVNAYRKIEVRFDDDNQF